MPENTILEKQTMLLAGPTGMLGGHTSEDLSGDSANAHSDETSLEDERAWTSSRLRLAAEADRALALAQAQCR